MKNIMSVEHQKNMNLLDGAANQTSKYRTKYCVEINVNTKPESYYLANQIKFQAIMIRSSLCDYSDA